MRNLVLIAIAASVAACTPPQQSDSTTPAPTPPPTVAACNTVTPDMTRTVQVQEAVASVAAADLRGGRIAPGAYDLISAVRLGQATGWQGARAVALDIAESAAGAVTFNWAGAAPGGDVDRWSATFTDAQQPRLSYTCGRMGDVDADFSAVGGELRLRLPDGANGSLDLTFTRRS